jgi:dolichol-phosphate mannosyltransferase
MGEQSLSLSVVVPVYNELENVEPLYLEIEKALAGASFEVIFVDDGSSDGTREKLTELAHAHKSLNIVMHQGNFGQSAAFVSGVRAARYPWIVTMDGDRQNDPADIPLLVKHVKAGKRAVVLGNRKKRDDSLLKKITSRVGNGIRQFVLNDNCPDTGCSLKLFPRDAFLAIPHFNHLHRYLPALFKRQGYEIINVKVNHRARVAGISKYGLMNRLFVGIYDLIGVVWLLRRPCNPNVVGEGHE